ncbi:MAG TPA: hypothetical protein VF041_22395 [Gemmatimonadaceae bacterium]
MITIHDVTITPAEISCGALVEISATVTFAGPPRDVTVTVEVQAPCTFAGGARRIQVRREGLPPHTVRLVERVFCPDGDGECVPRIRVSARDARGDFDEADGRVTVRC